MGRSNKPNANRLADEQQDRLDQLRETVARLNAKGRSGTLYHEELAHLEALAGEAPTAPSALTIADDQEDSHESA